MPSSSGRQLLLLLALLTLAALPAIQGKNPHFIQIHRIPTDAPVYMSHCQQHNTNRHVSSNIPRIWWSRKMSLPRLTARWRASRSQPSNGSRWVKRESLLYMKCNLVSHYCLLWFLSGWRTCQYQWKEVTSCAVQGWRPLLLPHHAKQEGAGRRRVLVCGQKPRGQSRQSTCLAPNCW